MKKKEVLEKIQGNWVHSYEEDTATEMVYRPAEYELPPSRGRFGFELKPDNRLVENNIAPTDAIAAESGSWELVSDDDNNLSIEFNPDRVSSRTLKIESVADDRLVIKKPTS